MNGPLDGVHVMLIHNALPGTAAKLGFDLETVRAISHDIVYCTITGYGQGGPYAGKPAYDDVIQAEVGLAALQGAGGAPRHGRPLATFVNVAEVDDEGRLVRLFGARTTSLRHEA